MLLLAKGSSTGRVLSDSSRRREAEKPLSMVVCRVRSCQRLRATISAMLVVASVADPLLRVAPEGYALVT